MCHQMSKNKSEILIHQILKFLEVEKNVSQMFQDQHFSSDLRTEVGKTDKRTFVQSGFFFCQHLQ